MKPFQRPAPHITRADTPLPDLEANVQTYLASERAATADCVAAEVRHLLDPLDHAWERLATTHPELCSTEADYPTWTLGGPQ